MASPLPDAQSTRQLLVDWAAEPQPVIVDAPPGALDRRRLAAEVETECDPCWLRLAPYDIDASAIDGLVDSVERVASAPRRTLSKRLLVVETARQDAESTIGTALASAAASTGRGLVLVVGGAGARTVVKDARVVRPRPVPVRAIRRLPDGAALDRGAARRLWMLTHGRAAIVGSVLSTTATVGPRRLGDILNTAKGGALLPRLATELIGPLPLVERVSLALAARVGFAHERFRSLMPVLDRCSRQPWWIPLTGGWYQFDPVWQGAVLQVALRNEPVRELAAAQLVGELLDQQATEEAIELCFDTGLVQLGRTLVARVAGTMVAEGRHASLSRWLQRLPASLDRRELAPLALGHSTQSPAAALQPAPRSEITPTKENADEATTDTTPSSQCAAGMECRLVGRFEVTVDGRTVTRWKGARARILLAYLLLHRDQPVTCEALAVAFWPDASPQSARNRLHVTLHSLRRSLREVTDRPIVVFARGYSINPDLPVAVDAERFDVLVDAGRHAEHRGALDESIAAYEAAVGLCRGDLLEEAPYEEWTLLPRERHRVSFLQALDRLTHLQFETGRYDDCVETCQRLLAADYCREDIHRILMRAYVRLNQPHLAVRQYKTCVRQLRTELDVDPDLETQQLFTLIRQRSPL